MSKNNSNYSHYDNLENIEIDGADDEKPGFFRRGWYRFKEFLTSDVVPFLKKYWFETTLAVLLLAFAIALIVMIQLYPVLILGIAFITIGNAMPFAFLGSMSVAAATASIIAIVLGVGALKIAVLSAIKNGISIFASWCWDRFKQEGDSGEPSPLDGASDSDSEFAPVPGPEPVLESVPEPVPEPANNENPLMILSPPNEFTSDNDTPQKDIFSDQTSKSTFFSPSPSPSHSSDYDFEPGLNSDDDGTPVLSLSDQEPSSTKSFCSIM